LTASGVATVLLAAVASTLWTPEYKSPSSADFA
jgi:hypothetical protein